MFSHRLKEHQLIKNIALFILSLIFGAVIGSAFVSIARGAEPDDPTIDSPAPAVPNDVVKIFATMDEAALYVVGKIYERSHHYEYGGVIVKGPKGYMISLPSTQRHGTDVSFSEDPEDYDYPIVATYHVHPCLKNVYPSVFSPPDLAGARTAKTPAYVLDECTGALHYWAPGDGYLTEDDMLKMGIPPMEVLLGHVQLATGKIVGTIKVDGTVIN
jgi:hypothetical protein